MHLGRCVRPCLCRGEAFLPDRVEISLPRQAGDHLTPRGALPRVRNLHSSDPPKDRLPSIYHGNAESLGRLDSSWQKTGSGLQAYKYSLSRVCPDPAFCTSSHSGLLKEQQHHLHEVLIATGNTISYYPGSSPSSVLQGGKNQS